MKEKLEQWLRSGVVPSVPADAEDEEPCSPAAYILMKPDAPRPDWRELATVTGWLMKSPDAPQEVAEIVVKALCETGRTEAEFNSEFERRLDEFRVPRIDGAGIHPSTSHRQDTQLCVALETAAAFLHHRTAA